MTGSPTCGCPTAATSASPPPTGRPPSRPWPADADAVVVIGSDNSSNTVALTKVAVAFGCPRVVRVNDASELPDDLSGTVGVTAGARPRRPWSTRWWTGWLPVHGVEHRAR